MPEDSKGRENTEVEIRSFIDGDAYGTLLDFFMKNSDFLGREHQETFYFDCEDDLRIQKNDRFAKLWLKKGEIHDDAREEIEVKAPIDQFEEMERLLDALGHNVEIKWFRDRHRFSWNGIKVCIDNTVGYGRIIELEMMASEDSKEEALEHLKERMEELDIPITPKSVFRERFLHYKENWEELTSHEG